MTDFIVVGNKNAMMWKSIFPKYFDGKLFYGYTYISKFRLPDNSYNWFQGSGRWFTTYLVHKDNPPLQLVPYDPSIHKPYDTYPALNTDSIHSIPDYDGEIGVPTGIIDYINEEQFEIVGILMNGASRYDYGKPIIDGKHLYTRILIRKIY